jgi:hypothetical protein
MSATTHNHSGYRGFSVIDRRDAIEKAIDEHYHAHWHHYPSQYRIAELFHIGSACLSDDYHIAVIVGDVCNDMKCFIEESKLEMLLIHSIEHIIDDRYSGTYTVHVEHMHMWWLQHIVEQSINYINSGVYLTLLEVIDRNTRQEDTIMQLTKLTYALPHTLTGMRDIRNDLRNLLQVIEHDRKLEISYVYTLRYPDGTPFYAGKGAGARVSQHVAECLSKPNESIKHRVISDIVGHGANVIEKIEVDMLSDYDARRIEDSMIHLLGPSGLLVNGEYLKIWSEEKHTAKIDALKTSDMYPE